MPSIELGHRRIEYTVVTGTSRRYTYFKFRPDMTLEVVRPRGGPFDAQAAIRGKLDWIVREHERMTNTHWVMGSDHVMFGGQPLKLVFAEGQGAAIVPDPLSGTLTVNNRDSRVVRELVRRWFLKETSAYVVRKVKEFSPVLGVRPSRVDVREINKWGYCTRSGRLSFSWQVIALPERLREYVVLHELTHLVEFNHSEAFRRRLASVCPDFRRRERDLDLVVPYDRMAIM